MKAALKIEVNRKPVAAAVEELRLAKRVPTMSMRQFRAYLHQAWVHGNESYDLPHEQSAVDSRNDFFDSICVREGFTRPVGAPV